MSNKIRLRFAPSPTGPLHIGGLRTALYNYLISKKLKGKFILRIEDTDLNRFNKNAEKHIVKSLKWCGIIPDESPDNPGKYGPYRQSERKKTYKEYVSQLIKSGHAYYAFDLKENLNHERKRHEIKGKTFIYNWHNRDKLDNSLNIDETKIQKLIKEKEYVIRFKTVESGNTKNELNIYDEIRGSIKVDLNHLDDKVIFKSDGMPTYHLANVIDDHLMNISHVIRGEEWLPSLALHVELYNAFDWEKPKFAHLPLILKPTGNGKLSKRDGEKYGFPVYPIKWVEDNKAKKILGFKELGYESTALINFISLIGWNPGNENEIISFKNLIDTFSIKRINKSGAKYDIEKAKWFNQEYVKKLNNEVFIEILEKKLKNKKVNKKILNEIITLTKGRLIFKNDIIKEANDILDETKIIKNNFIETKWSKNINEVLKILVEYVEKNNNILPEKIKEYYFNLLNKNKIKIGIGMQALRLSITGKSSGPDLFSIIKILDNSKTIKRIKKNIKIINDENRNNKRK
jgi:glutamyl-tRNA synthetase|tara:strand:+ start:1121 stop:2668 length:1548 start_codon:yes stop_codon:yes gene_type:complete